MKTKLLMTVAVTGLLMTQVNADTAPVESQFEIRNTYQYEYSQQSPSESAERKRIRSRDQKRLEQELADPDREAAKTMTQHRYQEGSQSHSSAENQSQRRYSDFSSRSSMSGNRSRGKR